MCRCFYCSSIFLFFYFYYQIVLFRHRGQYYIDDMRITVVVTLFVQKFVFIGYELITKTNLLVFSSSTVYRNYETLSTTLLSLNPKNRRKSYNPFSFFVEVYKFGI